MIFSSKHAHPKEVGFGEKVEGEFGKESTILAPARFKSTATIRGWLAKVMPIYQARLSSGGTYPPNKTTSEFLNGRASVAGEGRGLHGIGGNGAKD